MTMITMPPLLGQKPPSVDTAESGFNINSSSAGTAREEKQDSAGLPTLLVKQSGGAADNNPDYCDDLFVEITLDVMRMQQYFSLPPERLEEILRHPEAREGMVAHLDSILRNIDDIEAACSTELGAEGREQIRRYREQIEGMRGQLAFVGSPGGLTIDLSAVARNLADFGRGVMEGLGRLLFLLPIPGRNPAFN